MNFDLTIVWALIILLAIFVYVVLDGFDLGIGILFRRFPVGADRDAAMNSIAPVWDGNETWLVMGGGGLLAAFPLAYGLIFSALYAPIIAMLLALVFRGVAFEFRWRDPAHRSFWDLAFSGGSLFAALYSRKQSANEVEWNLLKFKFDDIEKYSSMDRAQSQFAKIFNGSKAEQSQVPFVCPALNLQKNQLKYFNY